MVTSCRYGISNRNAMALQRQSLHLLASRCHHALHIHMSLHIITLTLCSAETHNEETKFSLPTSAITKGSEFVINSILILSFL